ncbi:MAG: hypothetical protein WCU80_09470 [Paludibacteraceae bacterium]|nr:hypothetical protein [Prevotellaceae bacterium]
MKKVVLFFAVSAAIALASCGGNNADQNAQVDSTAIDTAVVVVADSAVADSAAADTTVAADSAAIVK